MVRVVRPPPPGLHPRRRDPGRPPPGDRRAGRRPAARTRAPPPPARSRPALAACTAITMEMYAERKGWDARRRRGRGRDGVRRSPACRGRSSSPCNCRRELTEDQRERLLAIAGKCPVHRVAAPRDRGHDRATGSSWSDVDLGLERAGLRGHRRQPRHRPRGRPAALRRGRQRAAGRARGGGRRRGGRGRRAPAKAAAEPGARPRRHRARTPASACSRPPTERFGAARRARQQRRHRAAARPRRGPRRGLAAPPASST